MRVTARGAARRGVLRLIVSESGREVARGLFDVGTDWQRCRLEFRLAGAPAGPLSLAIEGPGPESDGDLTITDVRLVQIFDVAAPLSLRFLTRGSFLLPSSRLRAFLIADYLDLVGWPVAVNRPLRADLVVCQKVRRWDALALARLSGGTIVYDLDDNELVQTRRRRLDIGAFSRMVDGVSVGSHFLDDLLGDFNKRRYLLDNMVDILDIDIVHEARPWGGRLVWFGMPENAWMLERVAAGLQVTRITRGGDIDFDAKGIDRSLMDFDLALLPVELNAATRAKNANRLVKCAGLGLPFLASDTPENRRAVAAIGLDEEVLVAGEADWPARIAETGRNYAAFHERVASARERAFAVYGRERIVADWIGWCRELIAEHAR
ncbi:MAG: hypothetical protein R3D02_07145 [Hyphomicrobiales bacterium]